ADALHPNDGRHERRAERQREVAVGDGPSEGAVLRPLGIDVDPLVVTGGVGEGVHLLLGDHELVGPAEVLADEGLELGVAVDGAGHGAIMACSAPTTENRDVRGRLSGTRCAGSRGSSGAAAARTARPGTPSG